MSKRLGQGAMKNKETIDRVVPAGIEPAAGPLTQFVAFISGERDWLGRLTK